MSEFSRDCSHKPHMASVQTPPGVKVKHHIVRTERTWKHYKNQMWRDI